jgi:hypothetical protein
MPWFFMRLHGRCRAFLLAKRWETTAARGAHEGIVRARTSALGTGMRRERAARFAVELRT